MQYADTCGIKYRMSLIAENYIFGNVRILMIYDK